MSTILPLLVGPLLVVMPAPLVPNVKEKIYAAEVVVHLPYLGVMESSAGKSCKNAFRLPAQSGLRMLSVLVLELGDLELYIVKSKREASHACTSRIFARVANT